MKRAILHWFGEHFGTLILAFVLAVVVWISAVVAADPNEEHTLRPIELQVIGQPANLVIVEEIPDQVRLTLNAPKSIWAKLNNNPSLATAWIDLTGKGAGEHSVEVMTQVNISPFRFVGVEPQFLNVRLESMVRREIPLQVKISGELPLGYRRGDPVVEPEKVVVSGPQSAVDRVALAQIDANLSGSIETIKRLVPIQFLDNAGQQVSGIDFSSKEAFLTIPINLLGRFKNVAVKVVTTGQVANGYRLTNISVTPPTFTVFSENPDLINDLPGFVETLPVGLQDLTDDASVSVDLNLPEGITAVRDPNVIVQISVAAIEGSLTLTLPVEVVNLSPDLQAAISPLTIDVIIAGPLFVLEQLTQENFRVVVDLTGLPPGVYQRTPVVELAPDQVRIQTTLPESVEVTIQIAPTSIITPQSPLPTTTPSGGVSATPGVIPKTPAPLP